MRNLLSSLVLVVLAGAFIAGCGGGDGKTVKIPGGGEVTSSDKLPSSFPGDFPIYDGAKVQGSVSGTSNGISGTTVTWETGDNVDKIKDFYTSEFDKGSWKSTATGTINDGAYWSGESKDGSKVFYAFATTQDGKTNVVVTIGDKQDASSSGSSDDENSNDDENATSSDAESDSSDSSGETPVSNELPAEVKLDKSFPTDRVPLPSARVTGSSSFGSGDSKTFSLVLLTKDDPEKVAQYFSDEMPKHGWSDSYSANSDGQFVVTFTSENASTGEALTVGAGESTSNPGYTEVSVSVNIVAAGG